MSRLHVSCTGCILMGHVGNPFRTLGRGKVELGTLWVCAKLMFVADLDFFFRFRIRDVHRPIKHHKHYYGSYKTFETASMSLAGFGNTRGFGENWIVGSCDCV